MREKVVKQGIGVEILFYIAVSHVLSSATTIGWCSAPGRPATTTRWRSIFHQVCFILALAVRYVTFSCFLSKFTPAELT